MCISSHSNDAIGRPARATIADGAAQHYAPEASVGARLQHWPHHDAMHPEAPPAIVKQTTHNLKTNFIPSNTILTKLQLLLCMHSGVTRLKYSRALGLLHMEKETEVKTTKHIFCHKKKLKNPVRTALCEKLA